jgi:glycosyltransferase involved in cell wall biosynthesis
LIPETCLRPANPPDNYLDPERPLEVVYIGRLAGEKDQTTLIRAMRHSTFAKRIHLTFAGNGPDAKKIKKQAHKLYSDGIVEIEPSFVFLSHDDLRRLSAKADLCVHCAVIEIEGLSILEAMQQGAVPVIADGPYTGSSQFALDERSLFPARDAKALAERMDYWLSHPQERWEAGKLYAASVKPYNIANSVEKMIAMFRDALNRQNHVEETA